MGRNKWKKNAVLVIAIFSIIMSMLNPALTTFADLGEAEEDFNKKSNEFFDGAEDATDLVEILDADADANPNPKRNSISYVMKRLFYPGVYVNNVEDGVLSTSIKESKDNIVYDGKSVCDPNAPKNLIHHNCNIPNFTTGLFQNIAEPWTDSFMGADKTTSYSTFGLGVPKNIPGGTVPVNPEDRKHTYTAMELFGYDLKLTAYSGEWDRITVSNSARMLSNFGVIDRITLTGTTLWNSAKDGVSAAIENFSWNPKRWFSGIAKTFEAAATSGINTVVDTSELNIVATNAWKRPSIDKTLYNVYVMSDKEILRETARNYFTIFHSSLVSKANENSQLNKVMGLNLSEAMDGIEFSYDPKMETEESKKAREEAEKQRDEDLAHNKSEKEREKYEKEYKNKTYKPKLREVTKIPKKEFYTEKEQLGLWEEDPKVEEVLSLAREEGILEKDSADGYSEYSKLTEEWKDNYEPYFQSNFDAMGDTIQEIMDGNDSDLFQEHPELDPKQGISKYACAEDDGSIKRKEDGTVEYLYTANNSGTTGFPNENCKAARPPIGGGLFGTGDKAGITDTRHVEMVSEDSMATGKINNVFTSTIRSVNSLIAKITNVVLGIAFSPILESLGINTIISKLVESFRDSIFFPLAGLTAALSGVLVFMQLLRNGSAWQLLASIAGMFFIFIVGATFLLHPTATINLLDEFPTKMDKVISDTILGSGNDNSYCSTGVDKDGIRSAQCSVWGAMVFEPWVHLQFGTGYDNLYAKGHAPDGGKAFSNTNGNLVGDASVDLGNGNVVNNWAMYQLSKMKYGTINSKDKSAKYGMIDKDMYRLVDLQAGPKGSGYDDRYFDTWSGKRGGGFLVVLTLAQAILMSLAISLLGFAKIEVSLMFSLSIVFLPFMLLYGMLPKGRVKLKGYLANLISLLIKRIVIVLMISVLLKVVMAAISKSPTLVDGAIISIFISVAFLMYRKEILEMITATEGGGGLLGGDPKQLKEVVSDTIPKGVKQQYSMMKNNIKGGVAGAIGGVAGAVEHKASLNARKMGIRTSLAGLSLAEKLRSKKGLSDEQIEKRTKLLEDSEETDQMLANSKNLSELKLNELIKLNDDRLNEIIELKDEIARLYRDADETGQLDDPEVQERISDLEKRVDSLDRKIDETERTIKGGARNDRGVLSSGMQGFGDSMNIIGRRTERQIRAEGFAPLSAYTDIKRSVYAEGAAEIADGKDLEAHDVYREQLSHSEQVKSKENPSINTEEQGQLMRPGVQRRVRKMAEKRKSHVNPTIKDKVISKVKRKELEDFETAAISNKQREELEKAARYIDKKRRGNILMKAKNPTLKKKLDDKRDKAIEESRKESSDIKNITDRIDDDYKIYIDEKSRGVKEKDRTVNPDEKTTYVDENGNTIEKDIFYERNKSDKEKREREQSESNERIKEETKKAREVQEEIDKFKEKAEELEKNKTKDDTKGDDEK